MAKSLPTADWQQLTDEAAAQIMEGAAAYRTLKADRPDYHHWVRISVAWLHLRNAAIKAAGLEEIDPRSAVKAHGYRTALQPLLDDDRAAGLKEVEASTRTHCIWLASNLQRVEEWYQTLALDDKGGGKLALNHPSTIYRRCPYGQKADRAIKALENEAAGTPSKSQRERDESEAGSDLLDQTRRASDKLTAAMSEPLALRKALDIEADPEAAADMLKSIHGDLPEPVLDRFAARFHSAMMDWPTTTNVIDWSTENPKDIGLAIAVSGHAAGRDNKFIIAALRAALAVLKTAGKPVEGASPEPVAKATESGDGASAAPAEAPMPKKPPRKKKQTEPPGERHWDDPIPLAS